MKAIIFDLNGIFLKAEYLSKRVEEEYGIDGDRFWGALRKVLNETRKPGAKNFFGLLKPHLRKLAFDIPEKEFFNFWFSGEKLASEVLKYIKELKEKGVKIFILSNNFRERVDYYRKNFPVIFKSIDKTYFSCETGFIKPDLKALKNILEDNDLREEECIYFDDSEENIESAKSLGIYAQKWTGVGEAKRFIAECSNDQEKMQKIKI